MGVASLETPAKRKRAARSHWRIQRARCMGADWEPVYRMPRAGCGRRPHTRVACAWRVFSLTDERDGGGVGSDRRGGQNFTARRLDVEDVAGGRIGRRVVGPAGE